MSDLINVKVMTPQKLLYSGKAVAVSSKNSEGKFDILASHANFITLIENETVTILQANNQKLDFKFKQAVIYSLKNDVTVMAEPTS